MVDTKSIRKHLSELLVFGFQNLKRKRVLKTDQEKQGVTSEIQRRGKDTSKHQGWRALQQKLTADTKLSILDVCGRSWLRLKSS